MGQVRDTFANGSFGTANNGGASSLVDEVREAATVVTSQAKELVAGSISKRQGQSALDLTDLADALRSKGEEMEGIIGPLVGKAAEQVDRASEYLMDANFNDVVRSTERFARREPALFLGGAFTLGVLCARFLKSSAHHADAVAGEANEAVES